MRGLNKRDAKALTKKLQKIQFTKAGQQNQKIKLLRGLIKLHRNSMKQMEGSKQQYKELLDQQIHKYFFVQKELAATKEQIEALKKAQDQPMNKEEHEDKLADLAQAESRNLFLEEKM